MKSKKVMEIKRLITIICLMTFVNNINAQQERQVSQFMYDNISINPGYAGSYDMILASAIYRNQWLGFGDGAPQNIILNLDAPFKLFKRTHGVGLSIYTDNIGFNKDVNLSLSYAYQINVGNGKLGIGISAGFFNRNLDPEWYFTAEGNPNDNAIPQGKNNAWIYDMGVGLFYKTEEIYVGVSSTHLFQDAFVFQSEGTSINTETDERLFRHYYLTAGYRFQLSNPSFEFLPAMLVESQIQPEGAMFRCDLNSTLRYNKKIWAGVSYRIGSAVIGMVGLEILNGVKIGYSYDFETTALSNHSKGSHEILISYAFMLGVEKATQKYKSIRFL
jgi:type IX secretion system PorP/SprF family membrane protein